MQHSVVAIFFSSTCLLCLDKISSIATDLSLALLTLCPVRSVVLSILRRDILMCVYWNNYVATLFMCSFFKIVSRPSFYVVTAFLLVVVATMFLVLLAFLSRLGKFVTTESCLHLT